MYYTKLNNFSVYLAFYTLAFYTLLMFLSVLLETDTPLSPQVNEGCWEIIKPNPFFQLLASTFRPGFCMAQCCFGLLRKLWPSRCAGWYLVCRHWVTAQRQRLHWVRLHFVLGTDLTGSGCVCDFTQQSCRTGVFISTYLSQYSIIPELLYLFSQYLIEKWLRNTEKILLIIEISIEYCYWYSTLEDSYHSEVISNPVICFHKMEARGYELISYDLETPQI